MKKKLFAVCLFLVFTSLVNAQEITGFKTETFVNEYGNFKLKIIPNTFDALKPRITKKSKVYGVRICYTQNGVKRVALQDMTYEIVTNGEYIYAPLGWGVWKRSSYY